MDEEQEHIVFLVTFNNGVKMMYDCAPSAEARELTSEIYWLDYCTALYNAMVLSLNSLRYEVEEKDRVLATVHGVEYVTATIF